MQQMPEEDNRTSGSASTTVQTTQLILNNNWSNMVLPIIKDAKNNIKICAYAWRWYPNEPEIDIQKFNSVLLKKAKNGVVINALVDKIITKDIFNSLGIKCRNLNSNKMVHTKAICVDDKYLILGSHNLTKRATFDNLEISVIINDFETVQQFVKYFTTLWGSSATS